MPFGALVVICTISVAGYHVVVACKYKWYNICKIIHQFEAFSMSCHVNLQSLLLPIAIFSSFIVEIILNACLIYLICCK
jgi:hypothetical protein